MAFQFLALYTGDYLRDTRHLTPMKHGIYLLLLMHCWDQKSPLPLDEQECAGIANCRSADEIDALRYIVGRFFVKLDDGHYNKRMCQEIERAAAISSKRSGAAQERWNARQMMQRAMQVHTKSNASAKQELWSCTIPTPTPTPTKERSTTTAESDLRSPSAEMVMERPKVKEKQKAPADDSPVVENIPLISGEFQVRQAFVDELDRAYPALDPLLTLREIRAWCIANPKNRKTASGAARFINGWFARAQNRSA